MPKKNNGPAGVPWGAVVPVAHVVVDLVSEATCPHCGSQVVLYVCFSCKKLVRPRRRGQAAA